MIWFLLIGSITQEVAITYDLSDTSSNLCQGTEDTETYGYDIEIKLQDYIDTAIEEAIATYKYTINYFYNGVQDTSETITGEAAEGLTITYTEKDKDGTYTLDETATTTTAMVISSTGENVLNIYYVSDDTTMVIAYYYLYDLENDETTTIELADSEIITGSVDDDYTTTQKTVDGYTYYYTAGGNTSGTMTSETIIVYYYYVLTDVTITNEIEKTADVTTLTDEDTVITYTINYDLSISDYTGTVDVTIVDILPYAIDESASDLDDGDYSATDNTITWTESIEVNSSYSATITKTISVVYEDVDVNLDIVNTVDATATIYYPDSYSLDPGGERATVTADDTNTIDQEYIVSVTVKKTWDDEITTHRPDSITVTLYADNDTAYDYDGEEVEPVELTGDDWEYTFSNLPKYDSEGYEITYTVEESETNDGDLEYYSDAEYVYGTEYIEIINTYKAKEIELDSEIEKTATAEITSSTDEVTYTINYTAIISEYTGDVTLTVVDTLPYAIDEDKSDLDGGTYNSNTNTITWEVSIEGLTGEDYEVSFSKTITVVYGENLDVSVSSIVNNVQATLYLINEGTTNTKTGEATTDVNIPATLIVRYLVKDSDPEVELADTITTETTAGTSYETEQKTFDGYTFVETNGVATSGTLPEGTTTVIYYYEQTPATVIVTYVDIDSGEEFEDSGETITGYVNDDYQTEEKSFYGYTLVETTNNTSGTMTEETIYVTYYYERISAKVVVYYYLYDDGYTTTELADTETIGGYVGKEYTTEQKDIDNYSYYTVVGETSGTMTEDTIVVYYYYSKIPATLTVNYYLYDNGYTTTKLADSVETNTYMGEDYETEQKGITGYTYAGTTGDATSGTISATETVVNYYYSANEATVVVTYVDTDGNTVAETETIEGNVNDDYETEEKTVTGYTLTETPENATGTMAEGTTYIEYVYKKDLETVIVYHYLYDESEAEDGHTTTEVADSEIKTGYYGDEYTTSASSTALEKYEFVESSSNTTGTYTDEVIYVYYYYKPLKAYVNVKYIDEDTEEEIADSESLTGYVGDEYTTEEKTIEYYVLDKTSSNTSGTYTKGTTEVTYYYRKARFNMSIDKVISSITKNDTTTDEDDSTLERVEVGKDETSSTTISVTYKITVTNTEELAGTATVVDYIPEYFTVSSSNPDYWTTNSDGNLETTVSLNAGESTELTVVLTWVQGTENFGTTTNIAKIISTSNTPGYSETTTSDNSASAQVLLSVRTGLDTARDVALTALIGLVVVGVMLGALKVRKNNKK